ncbi:hypothetical protein [Vibrio chagasii]|uniref:Uncharacterized protein n=1 Tax=Vibrio chagasii TaxID=170679 RepID=A0A7Y4DUI2_9VIBR|nr:hypothetical protein [Vibrio chagasii]NOH36412.1 hypothetical protein [Vibrio chagasii]
MPILKFLALVGVVTLVWFGLVDLFHNYGAMVGIPSLIFVVLVGRYLSRITLVKLKEKKVKQEREY